MALSDGVRDREFQKFCEVGGQTAVRTCTTIEGGTVESTPSGLQNDFRTTTMLIGDVAAPIPATALSDRNSLSIANLDLAETLYIGDSNVTADRVVGITSGWEVGPGETLNFDVKDTIIIYGRAESGKSIMVKVLEAS